MLRNVGDLPRRRPAMNRRHPRMRVIQYPGAPMINGEALESWAPGPKPGDDGCWLFQLKSRNWTVLHGASLR